MILGGKLPGKVGRCRFLLRLHGQAVKTPPFHGGNTGSIPVCVTIHAEVMEQADRADSKSVAARRVGSNPTFSTICS